MSERKARSYVSHVVRGHCVYDSNLVTAVTRPPLTFPSTFTEHQCYLQKVN